MKCYLGIQLMIRDGLIIILTFFSVVCIGQVDVNKIADDICLELYNCAGSESLEDVSLEVIEKCLSKLKEPGEMSSDEEMKLYEKLYYTCLSSYALRKSREVTESVELSSLLECPVAVSFEMIKGNILYEGVKNPFAYAVTNLRRDSISIESSKGDIVMKKTMSFISNLSPGMVEFKLRNKKKVISTFSHRVKELPRPVFSIDYFDSSIIPIDSLRASKGLRGRLIDFDWSVVPEISSFNITVYRNGANYKNITNIGSQFSQEALLLFESLMVFDVLHLDNIEFDLIDKSNDDRKIVAKNQQSGELLCLMK